jgi:hypothetical protein
MLDDRCIRGTPMEGKRVFSWVSRICVASRRSGISAFLCSQGLKAIVAAPANLCEVALVQTPFGRCHGNCSNAALVLRDRPQLRNIGRFTLGQSLRATSALGRAPAAVDPFCRIASNQKDG